MRRHRVQTHTDKISACQEARDELLQDIQEVEADVKYAKGVISRSQERIKELDSFQINASLRRPEILKQLAVITEEDIANGTLTCYCTYQNHDT
jgi:multidrug resistance efflux pump